VTTIPYLLSERETPPTVTRIRPRRTLKLPALTLLALRLRLRLMRCPGSTRTLCLRHAAWRLRGGASSLSVIGDAIARAKRMAGG